MQAVTVVCQALTLTSLDSGHVCLSRKKGVIVHAYQIKVLPMICICIPNREIKQIPIPKEKINKIKAKQIKKSKLCTSIQNEKGTCSTRNINELSMYGGYHIKTDKEIWRRYTFMKLKISYQPVSKDMQILR